MYVLILTIVALSAFGLRFPAYEVEIVTHFLFFLSFRWTKLQELLCICK